MLLRTPGLLHESYAECHTIEYDLCLDWRPAPNLYRANGKYVSASSCAVSAAADCPDSEIIAKYQDCGERIAVNGGAPLFMLGHAQQAHASWSEKAKAAYWSWQSMSACRFRAKRAMGDR